MALKPEFEQQARSLMKGLSLFAGCTEDHIQGLVADLGSRDLAKGKVILVEQEISKTLYILAKGTVGIWRRQGGQKNLVATLKAPDFFGETSMFTESPATALVKTEDDCRMFTLTRASFDAVLKKFPALGPLIHERMDALKAQRPPITKPEKSE